MAYIPKAQEIYRHFKGQLYQIITVAEHTETGEMLVIYQALYGSFQIYARPLDMFMQKVDRAKYPLSEQEYRFELVQSPLEGKYSKAQDTEKTAAPEKHAAQMVTEPVQAAGSAGTARTAGSAQTAAEPVREETAIDPLLLQFLDADTHEERLNILAAVHHRITDDMITTMAIASDVEVPQGDIETRYAALKNCLLMLEKYEINRLG